MYKSQKRLIEVYLPEPCNNATLIVNNESLNKLIIYPNPSHGVFKIEAYIKNSSKTGNLLLHDFSGNLIYRRSIIIKNNQIKEEINKVDLREGVYILTIEDGVKGISKKLIIKK